MDKKILYSISETASLLGETVTTVRFWSNTFSRFLAPVRNAKGNRQYTVRDIEVLQRIHYLTRECGLSLNAVARKLCVKEGGEDKSLIIRDSLLKIKEQLLEIRETL